MPFTMPELRRFLFDNSVSTMVYILIRAEKFDFMNYHFRYAETVDLYIIRGVQDL